MPTRPVPELVAAPKHFRNQSAKYRANATAHVLNPIVPSEHSILALVSRMEGLVHDAASRLLNRFQPRDE
jgi:hypothetical protein